ncbi:MAG TPA: hypothetical protein VGH49_14535 [Xanthobacteraceae bacterium]
MKELWRLAAADAHVRWTVDHADLGAEVVLASALGHGRLELCFGDARATPATGAAEAAAIREDDVAMAPVHVGRPEIPTGRISRSTPHVLAWERLRSTLGRLLHGRRPQPAGDRLTPAHSA